MCLRQALVKDSRHRFGAVLFGFSLTLLTACAGVKVAADTPVATSAKGASTTEQAASFSHEPLDREAMAAALDEACDTVRTCYNGAPTAIYVRTTFAPEGNALFAQVDKPTAVVGTMIADCVEGRFQSVRVRRFSGEPVTAGKQCSVGRVKSWECWDDPQCLGGYSPSYPILIPAR